MKAHQLLVLITTGLLCVAVYFVGACGKATPSAGVTSSPHYTCPMHPEVVREAPGSCPKCGMKLVAKAASNEPGK